MAILESETNCSVHAANGGLDPATDTAAENLKAIDRVVDLLAASHNILFITGAGISAESGLPTYRGAGGLYSLDALDDRMPLERALSGDMLSNHPEVTWNYLAHFERACCGARYNRAHEVIAEMEHHFERAWTLTQNVDGLHRAAGARNVIDIHGDLHELRCMECRYRRTVVDYRGLVFPPHCPQCPSLLRPDIVLFGEALILDRFITLMMELDRGFDMVFSIGTSSVFPYIAEPIHVAVTMGKPTVEINPGVSEVSEMVEIKLPMRAVPALDIIWQRYRLKHTGL